MKVTGIKSYAFEDDEGKLYFIAKVETDEGIYGLGEVGIPRWGNAVASAIEHLSQLVIGQDPFGTERLWQHMFQRRLLSGGQGVLLRDKRDRHRLVGHQG